MQNEQSPDTAFDDSAGISAEDPSILTNQALDRALEKFYRRIQKDFNQNLKNLKSELLEELSEFLEELDRRDRLLRAQIHAHNRDVDTTLGGGFNHFMMSGMMPLHGGQRLGYGPAMEGFSTGVNRRTEVIGRRVLTK